MDKIIKNLREQLLLLRRLHDLLRDLTDDLEQSASGPGVSSTVGAIETVMPDLLRAESDLQSILRAESVEDLNSHVEQQPDSVERTVAQRLLKQVGSLQLGVRKRLVTVSSLLVASKKFVDFNINVMSRASVGPTYGKLGNAPSARGSRSIFDANI